MTNNRLSIYVSSPDSYSDVLAVFIKGFRKYWSDCPYELILTTNSITYEGITCICNYKTGDGWVDRTLEALPKIHTKYILLLCDDIIISHNVNNKNIEMILDYMENHNIKFCRLNPLSHGEVIKELPILRKVYKNTPYAVNLQVGIFSKEYFEELLGDGSLSAWAIENKINAQASNARAEYFNDIVSTSQVVVPFIHGVYKGKWINSSIKMLKKRGLWIESTERGKTSFKTTLKIFVAELLQDKLSASARVKIKNLLRTLGCRFETDS